jgi:hypothetical protein
MHLRPREAVRLCRSLIDQTRQLGGVVTVSWHERSLVPERQWDGVYRQLLNDLQRAGASIRPARDVVAWFEARRSVDLEGVVFDRALLAAPTTRGATEPTLLIRVHRVDGATEVAVCGDDLDALFCSEAARS